MSQELRRGTLASKIAGYDPHSQLEQLRPMERAHEALQIPQESPNEFALLGKCDTNTVGDPASGHSKSNQPGTLSIALPHLAGLSA